MIKEYIQRKLLTIKWKKRNKHNGTAPGNVFNIDRVTVGRNTYGRISVLTFNDENSLSIGSFCSIAPEVIFMLSADHYVNHISTYPFRSKIVNPGENEGYSKGNIVVDDDVWIGYGATILSGVHIGRGAVIAANALVSKDVPPYAIVGGVPAKVIKYRFEPEIIEELLKIDYNSLTDSLIESHIDDLYEELRNKKQLDWMPKKGM